MASIELTDPIPRSSGNPGFLDHCIQRVTAGEKEATKVNVSSVCMENHEMHLPFSITLSKSNVDLAGCRFFFFTQMSRLVEATTTIGAEASPLILW